MTTRAWLPTDAATPLALWIDPSDRTTVDIDGYNNVLRARDKSGNGNTFLPYQTFVGPSLYTVNGQLAFRDNSSSIDMNRRLVCGTAGLNNITTQTNTLVCIAAFASGANSNSQFGFGVVTPSDTYANRAYAWETGDDGSVAIRHGTGAAKMVASTMSPAGSIGIQTRSGVNIVSYVDGAQAGTASNATDFIANSGTWRINGWVDPNTPSYGNAPPAWVGDCLIYVGVLSVSDRQCLEGYLAWKWGTQARLPVDHPYKAAAPIYSTSTSYSLPVASGAFVATGVSANMIRDTHSPAAGAFVLTGKGVGVRRSYAPAVAGGSVAVTGRAAALTATRLLSVAGGALAIVGYGVLFARSMSPPVSRRLTLTDAAAATKTFDYTMDPSDIVDFWATVSQGTDIGDMLRDGENVASWQLTATAEAVAAGFQILQTADRLPHLVDRAFRFWVAIAAARQSDDVFSGKGVELVTELTVTTDSTPSRRFQRSMTVKVAQQ
jgi:hypothetical protein